MDINTIYNAMQKQAAADQAMIKEANWLTDFFKQFRILTAGGRRSAYLEKLTNRLNRTGLANQEIMDRAKKALTNISKKPSIGGMPADTVSKALTDWTLNAAFARSENIGGLGKLVANPGDWQRRADRFYNEAAKKLRRNLYIGSGIAGAGATAYGLTPDSTPPPPPSPYEQFKSWLSQKLG